MSHQPKILIIYTGGTIGMVASDDDSGLIPFNFEHLEQQVPQLKKVSAEISIESFDEPIDSSNMTPKIWSKIAEKIYHNYAKYDGFVILHGSDTMAYTASALSFMLQGLTKPVILTGSQLPIDSLRTDGKENLITSIEIAAKHQGGEPLIQEVAIYFEDNLYRGNRTSKVNAEDFEAFESFNYPKLAEVGVRIKINRPVLYRTHLNEIELNTQFCDDVLILKLFPGINKNTLQHLLDTPNIKGIILETYGAGNTLSEPWFLNELETAIKKGIIIFNVSQCHGGMVEQGLYETSFGLEKIGVIGGADITSEAAVCKLMYLFGQEFSHEEIKLKLRRSIAGEQTPKTNLSLEN